VTTALTDRTAGLLAQLDTATATTRVANAVEATDRDAVLLTDEGLAVAYAPDRRFPGEPYRDGDGLRYSRQWLGALRTVEAE
jgi:hypothetical protein